ncbi:uncharacterized protein LOC108164034 [Drosophila miranda]|uniref:uncharacterized protein LOC108164034 n=1 Tax=Drosophila miranda TaxID=7229 RepID=UPI0007E74931|nr:uncharacterized protein LOC108164034 [Drosophila miranda]
MVPPVTAVTTSTMRPTAATGQETFSVPSTSIAYRPSRSMRLYQLIPRPKLLISLMTVQRWTPLNDATNDLSRAIFDDGPSPLPAKPLPKSLFDDDLEDDFLSSFSPKPKPP